MTPVACVSGVDLLMEYLEGTLPPEVRAALEAHVAGCERCVAFIASYQATPRLLQDATEVELPSDIRERLQAFVRRLSRPLE